VPLAGFLAPGMRLGKYQLIRQLAIGGMAEVYLARAQGIEGFSKRVVLKRILPQYATNEDFIEMFLSEARLAATLDHPNVVQVYDFGSTVGNYYFTMEYVHGLDARTILKAEYRDGRRVPLGCALSIVRGLCAGLHYAHEKRAPSGEPLGIVHRDVSLSNVLVSYDGAIKVVDFGVAKVAARGAVTRAGTLKGKISYMSPEQCSGLELDRRSDVFAIGIVLYELTTSSRLFTADNEFAILQKIANHDVEPPSNRWPDYPPALEAIVLRALHRDPGQRYQTARELQRDLEEFARDEKLSVSSIDLIDYMQSRFADRLASEPSDSEVLAAARRPKISPAALRADPSIIIVDATDQTLPDAPPAPRTWLPSGPSGSLAAGTGANAQNPPDVLGDQTDAAATGWLGALQRLTASPTWRPQARALLSERRTQLGLAAAGLAAVLLAASLTVTTEPAVGAAVLELPAAEPVAERSHAISVAPRDNPPLRRTAAASRPTRAAPPRARPRRAPRTKNLGPAARPRLHNGGKWNPDSALPPPL
jgi:eukaryotic-like serine/threonine-protein kinase